MSIILESMETSKNPENTRIHAVAGVQRSKDQDLDLVIGSGDLELVHKIKEDLEHFYEKTKDTVLSIGGNTYRSMKKYGVKFADHWPQVVVLTSSDEEPPEGVTFVRNKEDFLSKSVELAKERGVNVSVGGGSQIYEIMMDHVDRLYITEIPGDKPGDRKFPAWDKNFKETDRKNLTTQSGVDISFVTFDRI